MFAVGFAAGCGAMMVLLFLVEMVRRWDRESGATLESKEPWLR